VSVVARHATLSPGEAVVAVQRGEVFLQGRAQPRLVVLDVQDVVAALLDDLRGDFLLAAHRVDRHQGALQL